MCRLLPGTPGRDQRDPQRPGPRAPSPPGLNPGSCTSSSTALQRYPRDRAPGRLFLKLTALGAGGRSPASAPQPTTPSRRPSPPAPDPGPLPVPEALDTMVVCDWQLSTWSGTGVLKGAPGSLHSPLLSSRASIHPSCAGPQTFCVALCSSVGWPEPAGLPPAPWSHLACPLLSCAMTVATW